VSVDSIRLIPSLGTAVPNALPPRVNGHNRKPIVAIVPAIKGKNAGESSRFDFASDAARIKSRTNRPPMRVARAIQRRSILKKWAAIDLVVTNSFILPLALP
jgi:hypothetical protein